MAFLLLDCCKILDELDLCDYVCKTRLHDHVSKDEAYLLCIKTVLSMNFLACVMVIHCNSDQLFRIENGLELL